MIVMKFGGSSVGTAEAIRQVAAIVARFRDRRPVLVVSAMQGVTDQLLSAARSAAARSPEARTILASIRERHERTLTELAPGAVDAVRTLLSDLEKRLSEVEAAGMLEPWAQDEIVSFGERLSVPIVAAAVGGRAVDARACIRTDGRFIGADVDFQASNGAIRETILPMVEAGVIPVVTGYIGAGPDGRTTTLGRGGSDYTVTVLGGALGADEIWIWKEVDGLMTADPRVVPEAAVLPEVSYEEAAEMSYYGAKVLHPKTMMPAMRSGVPVRMRNTFRPEAEGTVIGHASAPSPQGVKAVTAIRDLAMVAIVGDAMRGRPGIAGRLFTAMGDAGVNILAIAQGSSERNITFVVRGEDADRAVRAAHTAFELEKISISVCEPSN